MSRVVPLTRQNSAVSESALEQEALRHWPGLDAIELFRCGGDPEQVAGVIARYANLSSDAVSAILVQSERAEPPFYFG